MQKEANQDSANEGARLVEFLSNVPLFATLERHELQDLALDLRRRSYRAREVIFHKDDPGFALYIIATGSVKVYLPSPEGQEALLAVLLSGDYFGELALLDGGPRTATVATMEASEVLLLERDDFLKFVREHPRAVAGTLQSLGALVRRSTNQLEDALFLDLRARLAKRLLELADRHGNHTGKGIEIQITVTQGDLAAMVGATRVSVNRQLNQLRDAGVVDWAGRRLVICNVQELRRQTGI